MSENKIKDNPEEPFEKLLNDPEIPRLYANHSFNFNTANDISILLMNNKVPVAVLNLSFNMAKTLAITIGELIRDIEETTGTQIFTSLEISKLFAEKEQKVKVEPNV